MDVLEEFILRLKPNLQPECAVTKYQDWLQILKYVRLFYKNFPSRKKKKDYSNGFLLHLINWSFFVDYYKGVDDKVTQILAKT